MADAGAISQGGISKMGEGIHTLKQDAFIQAQLVSAGWRFTQFYNQGHMGGQMVMHALANRVRVGWAPWLQVIERVPQFMAENELPPLTFPSVWDPAFVKLLHAVEGVMDGSAPDLTKGALYFGDLARIERSWFQEKIVQGENHARVASMNGLNFWR